MNLKMIATCGLGLEEILSTELKALDFKDVQPQKGAVTFLGTWQDCWRANWLLRTANRVLVELGRFPGDDGERLSRGARALVRRRKVGAGSLNLGKLFHPDKTFSIRATTSASRIRDLRWAALKVKDGLVDGQRDLHGRRSSVSKKQPDLAFRLRLHRDEATLTLDTSGDSLDRRGYRVETTEAPVREQLAAACVLASGWDGHGPVVDPMCGSGTLLAEAALIALGRPPGHPLRRWAFQKLPSFNQKNFDTVKNRQQIPVPGPDVKLFGVDHNASAIRAARLNLRKAGLWERSHLEHEDAFNFEPPEGPGLLVVNPAYGERLAETKDQWKRLGDLFKQSYKGWRAVVLAGGPSRGKHIGLRPQRRIPVFNGPLEARILIFELY